MRPARDNDGESDMSTTEDEVMGDAAVRAEGRADRTSMSVDRPLSILESLADGPKSISEVAREIDVHRSTALRLLRALEHRHYVRRDADMRYRLGSMLFSLGYQALEDVDLRNLAGPHLAKLNETSRDTVHLGILEDDQVLYLDKIDGHAAVRLWSRVGKRSSLHCTGLGKAMAAFLPPEELEPLAHRLTYEVHTPTTIAGPDEFLAQMEQIREQGWAIDDAEHEPLVHCVAAPVLKPDGEVAGAISVASPVTPLSKLRAFVPDLLATAAAISSEYGARTP
jgi:DNA-binding IclR family transcriptional regulator